MTHIASASGKPTASGAVEGQLRGNMGVRELVFTALAFNAPLAAVAGFVPVIAGFEIGFGSPLLFPAMGLLLLVFSVGLNAMAVRMERPGAFYSYIARGLGRPAGLAAAFCAVLTYAALAAGIFILLGLAAGDFAHGVLGIVDAGPWWVWGLIGWLAVTALTLLNIEVSAKVLGIAMLFEVVIVAVWNLMVFSDGGPDGRGVDVLGNVFNGSIALPLLFVALCMTGFESLQVFREETRDAERTVPRATYIFLIVLAVGYGLTTYIYVIAQGSSEALAAGAANPTGTFLGSIEHYVGSVASDAASLFLVTSAFACALAIQNIVSRYLYALGRDRVVPGVLGRVNERHGSPVVASLVGGVGVLVIFLIPVVNDADAVASYAALSGLGIYGILLLWAVTSVAVLVFFRRSSVSDIGLWRSVVAPLASLVGLVAVSWLATAHLGDVVGNLALARGVLIFTGAVALAGFVLALRWRRVDPDIYARIGRQDA
ncbi:APC family permease [Aeromicrobium yanjiei]|uniref:Amino acid permease n=1 Tax=Aeromicrobium yanjiei TaxID=2662028 RepID=A0A5Q2MJV1_9ACTN|nr:APC family permease [Aeromicrobium yanjiei]QGG40575.1 amino acid permease [Aeromicrobium yanjiei]